MATGTPDSTGEEVSDLADAVEAGAFGEPEVKSGFLS